MNTDTRPPSHVEKHARLSQSQRVFITRPGGLTPHCFGIRVSCHDFVDNQVRLHLFVPAYNLGNFLRQAQIGAERSFCHGKPGPDWKKD